MRLLVATRSVGKQGEIRRILAPAGIEVVFPDEIGIYQSSPEELLELGESFQANARAKAEHFARTSGLPTAADDSGLEVLSLGGQPGVRSKRWAGATGSPKAVDAANNAELLRRLSGAAEGRRQARYRCVVVYLRGPGAIPEVFEGACAGRILEAPAGSAGFGYDPLFFSDDLGKSFGEAEPGEKDPVSHRGRAFHALAAALTPALHG
ncbi:MAG: non-canonical purine NTP pyrophosphatase [Gemmatimonadales bacterium]